VRPPAIRRTVGPLDILGRQRRGARLRRPIRPGRAAQADRPVDLGRRPVGHGSVAGSEAAVPATGTGGPQCRPVSSSRARKPQTLRQRSAGRTSSAPGPVAGRPSTVPTGDTSTGARSSCGPTPTTRVSRRCSAWQRCWPSGAPRSRSSIRQGCPTGGMLRTRGSPAGRTHGPGSHRAPACSRSSRSRSRRNRRGRNRRSTRRRRPQRTSVTRRCWRSASGTSGLPTSCPTTGISTSSSVWNTAETHSTRSIGTSGAIASTPVHQAGRAGSRRQRHTTKTARRCVAGCCRASPTRLAERSCASTSGRSTGTSGATPARTAWAAILARGWRTSSG
jgi:hypothetical protein